MNCLIGILVILATTTVEAVTSESPSAITVTSTTENPPNSTEISTTDTIEGSTIEGPSNIPETSTTTSEEDFTSQGPSNTNETSQPTTPGPSSDPTIKTTSLPSPTTTTSRVAPDNYTVTLGKTPVALSMSISLFTDTNDTINLSDQEQYRNVSERIEKDLTKLFNGLPGFQRIEITDLKKGSIIASYRLIISADKLQEAVNHIGNIEDNLVKAQIAGRKVNETYTKATMTTAVKVNTVYSSICESLNAHDGCRYGYTCLATGYTTIICVSQCSQKPGFCENRGDCYVDSRDDKLKCRCHDDDTYAYSGDRCDTKTEKLKMESNYIIAIAASCGGVLVLIILILVAVLLWRRKKQANKEYKEENHRSVIMDDLRIQKFDDGPYNGYQGYHPRPQTARRGSVSMDDFQLQKFDDGSYNGYQGYHPRSPTAGNAYDSGIPEPRVIRGREHRVLKDNRGSETLIYQPSNLPRPYSRSSQELDTDNRASRVPPFYDQINVDRKYEKSRPQVYPPERNYSKLIHDRRDRFGY